MSPQWYSTYYPESFWSWGLTFKIIFLPGTQHIISYQFLFCFLWPARFARKIYLGPPLYLPRCLLPTGKLSSRWESLFPPGSSLPTFTGKPSSHWQAPFLPGRRKLSSHWDALFQLGSFLPTMKLFSHWEALFPLRSSFPLGSFLPTGKFSSYRDALFPPGSSLPTGKLKAPFPPGSYLSTGKLSSLLGSGKLSSHWKVFFPLASSLGLPTRKLFSHWEALFPLRSSFLLEALFPPGRSLPTGMLPFHREAPYPPGNSLPTGKLKVPFPPGSWKLLSHRGLFSHRKARNLSSHR